MITLALYAFNAHALYVHALYVNTYTKYAHICMHWEYMYMYLHALCMNMYYICKHFVCLHCMCMCTRPTEKS